jgi:hypothetical protein
MEYPTQNRCNAFQEYTTLCTEREPYLQRARDCSLLTIPRLFPEQGFNGDTKLLSTYNSVGAKGINTLASAMMLALLPPQNTPFFRLVVDDGELRKAAEDSLDIDTVKEELDDSFADFERLVIQELEVVNARPVVYEIVKQLLVGGNVMLYVGEDNRLKSIHLENYVVKRDPSGTVLKIFVCEWVHRDALPVGLAITPEMVAANDQGDGLLPLMTKVERTPEGKYKAYQSLCGLVIEGTEQTFSEEDMPFLALRLYETSGQSYSRSLVEEYYGDLKSTEGLSQSIVEFAAAASRILFLVAANGTTDERDLNNAENGAFITGNAADVTALQMEKFADFRVVKEVSDEIKARLNQVFLITTDMIRNAERVTAEEVRLIQQQVEQQHGAAYAMLAVSFQLPLVRLVMKQMAKQGKLPDLPFDFVTPMIVTGVDAMGRGQDLIRLDSFIGGMAQALGPEVVSQRIHIGEFLKRRANALGLNEKGLVVTEQELQERAAQQAEQQQTQLALEAANTKVAGNLTDPSKVQQPQA